MSDNNPIDIYFATIMNKKILNEDYSINGDYGSSYSNIEDNFNYD